MLAALFVLASVPCAVARDAGAPYGADFARVAAAWEEAGPSRMLTMPAAPEADAATPEAVAQLRRRLAALEAEAGPYAAGLEEPLASLGAAFAAAGDFGAATGAYRRALHVLRVNEGLYGERQKPLLAALLGAYRAAGDWEALDEAYPWVFRLYGQGAPPLTGSRLRAALAYLRWQREALRRELPGDRDRRLLALLDLGAELTVRGDDDGAIAWAGRRALAFSQLRNLYLLEVRVAPPVEDPFLRQRRDAFGQRGALEVDPQQDRLRTLQRTALGDGRALLEGLLAAAPDARGRAEVLLELGDWLQWHGRDRSATEHYLGALAALRADGGDAAVATHFGAPVELPANGVFWQPEVPADGEVLPVVEARFDVSDAGRARRVAGETLRGRASARIPVLRGLRDVRFRPRFEDGRPVATTLTRRYEVYD